MHPHLRVIACAFAPFAAVLLAACFDFDATMAGGPLVDAGAPASVVDASVLDGSLPSDANPGAADAAPSDAGNVLDAGGSFCASQVPPDGGIFFCDDFDEQNPLGIWQNYDELGGTLVVTDASALSPPNSVDETTMALANGQAINLALRTPEPIVTVPATLIFAFSLEPLQIDTTANAGIVLGAVDFLDGAGNRYTVGLAIDVVNGQPALTLGEQSGPANGGPFPDGAPPLYINHPLPQTDVLPLKAWSSIVIEIDWTATSLAGKVSVNGGQELGTSLMMTLVPTSLQIGIGTSFVTEYEAGLSPVWELRYDNVLFTAH
jgi:hypothetical protein